MDTPYPSSVEHLENGITHITYTLAASAEGLEEATRLSAEAIANGSHPFIAHLIPCEARDAGETTDHYQGCDILLVASGHLATWKWLDAMSQADAEKLVMRFATMLLLITGELDPQSALNAFAALPKVDPHP